jgi:hypothetical protein
MVTQRSSRSISKMPGMAKTGAKSVAYSMCPRHSSATPEDISYPESGPVIPGLSRDQRAEPGPTR